MAKAAPSSGNAKKMKANLVLEPKPEISTTQGMHTAGSKYVENETRTCVRPDASTRSGHRRAERARPACPRRGSGPRVPGGALHQQFACARPTRARLIELRKIEHEIARLRQGRKRAAIVQLKRGRGSAGPRHETGFLCARIGEAVDDSTRRRDAQIKEVEPER